MRQDLPSGTVSFLFTDIERSTALLQRLGDGYAEVLAEHHRLLRAVWERREGVEVGSAGDGFFVAFPRAADAVGAAEAAQAALHGGPLRVRMGIHTGEPLLTETGYVGIDVHRAARIASAAHGGQVLLSRTTRDLVDVSVRNLGPHRLKDLSAPEELYQLGDDSFPPLRSLHQTNLPVQPNPLVGRTRELAQVTELVRSGRRLVTLTGAGGSGKTRLALHAAAELAEEFPDGVWFVPLAPLSDPAFVEQSVANVLGARGSLKEDLRAKRLLLVLDNFEHLLDAAPGISELVAAAPGVRVIATSRERLGVAAEQEYVVPILPLDDAIELFTVRATRLAIEFEPDEHVVEIARRLDGLPLALELAAARVKVLSTAEILDRLGSSLGLLTGGGRDAPERQRTLRATISWSYELLAEDERSVFAALGVFAGSFTREAAERVTGANLDALGSLVDKSLLGRAADGRFFLLQTIREFALERLAGSGRAQDIADRHARCYSELAERAEGAFRTENEDDAVHALVRDNENIRAAFDHLEKSADQEAHVKLAGAAWYFWYLTGQLTEARQRLQAALEASGGVDPTLVASLHDGLSSVLVVRGDAVGARPHADASLRIRRGLPKSGGLLRSLLGKSMVEDLAGNPEGAEQFLRECADLALELDDAWFQTVALHNLGVSLISGGDSRSARTVLEQARALSDAHPNTLVAESIAINAAAAAIEEGEFEHARRELEAVLERCAAYPELVIWSLVWMAAIEEASQSFSRAAMLLGAVDELTAATSFALTPMERRRYDRTWEQVEAALEREAAAAARARGRELSREEAIALARGSEA